MSGTVQSGFRLHALEVFNWGTFDGSVWRLETGGADALLTGDIGSGKSTLVDAVTTLLVPWQEISYNKAAGASGRERTLRSYVLGHYKSERGESGARAVALRDANSYSVVLARFEDGASRQTVTLAQVFWTPDEGQPHRMLVVAERGLTIADHFSDFGTDVGDLRKKLRRLSKVRVHDTFPPYGAEFRRLLGIPGEQAMDLFNQTVSLKSVGNLTDFVREHMLPSGDGARRIRDMIAHFDALDGAHRAVVKARTQIAQLEPLVQRWEQHQEAVQRAASLREARDGLRPWFTFRKIELLGARLEGLDAEIARAEQRLASVREGVERERRRRDDLRMDIAHNGGTRLENLKTELARLRETHAEKRERAQSFEHAAAALGFPAPEDAPSFDALRSRFTEAQETAETARARLQNEAYDARRARDALEQEVRTLEGEIASLRQRKSNLPSTILAIRTQLCAALGLREDDLPFAGELLRVRERERAWEGAIERVMHAFGLSLLVPDASYTDVARWVDGTHLRDRLVYYRVRRTRPEPAPALHPDSLVHKLEIKPGCAYEAWLDAEIARRFDLACAETLDQFRRESRALTRSGQIKQGHERHEKDDRHRIDDRARYVLGWTNLEKIAALEVTLRTTQDALAVEDLRFAAVQRSLKDTEDGLRLLGNLLRVQRYGEIDWRTPAAQIEALEAERAQLERGSDVLRALQEKLRVVDAEIANLEADHRRLGDDQAKRTDRREALRSLRLQSEREVAGIEPAVRERLAVLPSRLPQWEALGALTLESCDAREREVRETLQARIDAEDKRIGNLRSETERAMEAYRTEHPIDTKETDARVDAGPEYAAMLARLRTDDLPRFETRFKQLLHENTLHEIANFQSHLDQERATIQDRIRAINGSLQEIEYNPGTYICLVETATQDAEIRDFRQQLRSCTEGSLRASEDAARAEEKFERIKQLIDRFRGRDGSTDLDQRWTTKVTDVRNWFLFSASERWREDGQEREHYTDSGGKSGGQKEKLAYTVLAASLAYQFGLGREGESTRSFRFVVIDEAFGRGSDESTRYGLELFHRLGLQLLVVTPLQKIRVIEPYVASVGFVHNEDGRRSMLRSLTIEAYREERETRERTHGRGD